MTDTINILVTVESITIHGLVKNLKITNINYDIQYVTVESAMKYTRCLIVHLKTTKTKEKLIRKDCVIHSTIHQ